MKKMLALIVALTLALTCLSAFADSVYTRLTIDRQAASDLLTGFEVPEDQIAMVDPILALVNALGMNVIILDDGAQIDWDLNGTNALSLGFALDDAGIAVGSTLFPNYLLTVSSDTIVQLMEQVAASIPAASDEGGVDMSAVQEVLGGYFERWAEACSTAGQPGEPVTGEYTFEGYTFDTLVPVTVDMAAITEATTNLLNDLLADPAAMGMLKGFAQGYSQSTGENFDEASFEADFKAAFEEWMAHFPATASAEFYANSDSEGTPFYLYGEAIREGEAEAVTFHMLFVDETNMKIDYQDSQSMNAGFELVDTDMSLYCTIEGVYIGLGIHVDDQFTVDLYFIDESKPLATLSIAIGNDTERTLSLDEAGKTVLAIEDLMGDEADEAVGGLAGDIMTNGLSGLITAISEQVPEVMDLLNAFGAAA